MARDSLCSVAWLLPPGCPAAVTWQCEMTDKWLKNSNPWDIARSEIAYEVKFWWAHRGVGGRAGSLPCALDSTNGGARRRLRHADRQLAR